MLPKNKTTVSALTGVIGKDIEEWSMWYGGDVNRIANYYLNQLVTVPNGHFWQSLENEERADAVHIPLAGDIASTSANLLFGEPPEIQYDENVAAGARLTDFINFSGLERKLMEAAELAAGMGGTYLKLDIDETISNQPLLSVRTPQEAIPTFRGGHLAEVLFWRVYDVENTKNGQKVRRLFENRAIRNGGLAITYGFYEGTSTNIGDKLDSFPEDIDVRDVFFPNIDGLGVVYIPNILPNRKYPSKLQGQADFAQCIPMLDSLDETWSSWMRDIELGMGRIFVDEELLESNVPVNPSSLNAENRPKFDVFQRAFVTLNMTGWKLEGSQAKPINVEQFEIRVEDHKTTAQSLIENIVSRSGYSPQTFGIGIEGRAESGTALRIRERKSYLTQRKKAKYWRPALNRLFKDMQLLDIATGLSTRYEVIDVDFVPDESVVNDQLEVSETIRNLSQAEAISTEIKVRMAHPDWVEEDVQNEVERIQNESGIFQAPEYQGA